MSSDFRFDIAEKSDENIRPHSSLSVFVTGGNSGIGFALCRQLAVDHGCRVFLGARDCSRGLQAVDKIEKALNERYGPCKSKSVTQEGFPSSDSDEALPNLSLKKYVKATRSTEARNVPEPSSISLSSTAPDSSVNNINNLLNLNYTTGFRGSVTFIECDVSSSVSVLKAAETMGGILRSECTKLYAIVNNAGCGLQHRMKTATGDSIPIPDHMILDVNLVGARRVVEAFLPLLMAEEDVVTKTSNLLKNARIVNVGSGAGPRFVQQCSDFELKRRLSSSDKGFRTLEEIFEGVGSGVWANELLCQHGQSSSKNNNLAYGLSKALLTAYTIYLSRYDTEIRRKRISVSCLTPGFVDTAIVKGFGSKGSKKKSPEDGTLAIKHCIFYPQPDGLGLPKIGSAAWFFGSDGVRSPLDKYRGPGDPPFGSIQQLTESPSSDSCSASLELKKARKD